MTKIDRGIVEVVDRWRHLAEHDVGLRSFDLVRFADLPCDEIAEDHLAWLPRPAVRLCQTLGMRWRLDDHDGRPAGEGTTRTLELLRAAVPRPRVQSALLLAAALRDLSRAPPPGWSPDGTLLAKTEFLSLAAALDAGGFGSWPASAGPALPRSFAKANPVLRGVPAEADGVLIAAAISVAATLAAWAPAVLRPPS